MNRSVSLGFLVVATVLFASCGDTVDDENDILVFNGSGCSLAVVTLDGVDKGAIGAGETRTFDDVSDGVHHLGAFRHGSDDDPCDTHTTEDLDGNDNEYWTIQCACD